MRAMGQEIRSWHWAKRSDKSLGDLALMFNSIVQGWINYYGRFLLTITKFPSQGPAAIR
jgi:RNA-directed DNA polymerase